jgi:hypothetical protein
MKGIKKGILTPFSLILFIFQHFPEYCYFLTFIGVLQQIKSQTPAQSQTASTLTTIPQTLQLYFIPFLLTAGFFAAGFAATFFAAGIVFVANAVLVAINSPLLYFFLAATVFATAFAATFFAAAGFFAADFTAGFAAAFLVAGFATAFFATGFAATFFAAGFAAGFAAAFFAATFFAAGFAAGFVPIYSPLFYICKTPATLFLFYINILFCQEQILEKSIIFIGILKKFIHFVNNLRKSMQDGVSHKVKQKYGYNADTQQNKK